MSTNYLGANVHGLASPAAAVPVDALPPLPKAKHEIDTYHNDGTVTSQDGYTAAEVEEIRRAAVEADRAQRPDYKLWYDAVTDACVVAGELPWDESDARGSLAKLIAWREEIALDPAVSERAAALADRAQQGEPVVCAPNCFYGDCPPCVEAGVAPSATKAAAPADAPTMESLVDALRNAALDLLELKGDASAKLEIAGEPPLYVLVGHADGIAKLLPGATPVPDTGIPTANPLDWPLPCDVKVGSGTNKKGTPLSTLVARMKTLHSMATESFGAPNVADLVNRFLAWPLPESLRASLPGVEQPIGTHLMNADEARAMFDYVLARRCRAQGGMTKDNDNFRAPVSSTPTSGAVEKARKDTCDGCDPAEGFCRVCRDSERAAKEKA